MATNERRNGSQWQSIIAAQEKSGLSAKAYCREHGVGLASFYSWRKRLTIEVGVVAKKVERDFIELKQGAQKAAEIERTGFEAVLDLGDGISMTLRRR